MKLNWFSPLLPAGTDIAHYTARVLPAFASDIEVTLWTDRDEWDKSLEKKFEVRRYHVERLDWSELNRSDACVYQIGNDPRFHGSIWQVSRRHAGIVVLHDLRLQNFFAGLYREGWNDRAGFLELMQRYHGEEGRRDADYFWDGGYSTEHLSEHYSLTFAALENALGVVVHTTAAFETIGGARRWPVVFAPLPYAAKRLTKRRQETSARLRRDAPPYRLVVFGYMGANRRLDSILRALAEFPQRELFRLDIYGHAWNVRRLRSSIDSLNLEGQVMLHGFVPERELDAALASAHMAFNLRYPSMGEASGSQLRIWNHALPSMVTPVESYASMPEETVAFVRHESEVEDIHEHLRAFLAEPSRFARMGENGRRRLEESHSPQQYARTLASFVESVESFRLRAAACSLAGRAGREIGACFESPVEAGLSSRIAGKIHSMIL